MVRSEDMPPVSDFTREFARILNGFVADFGLSRQAIADEAGRSRSFVSDQLLGKRPVDTDILTAIAAQMGGITARFLARQVLDQMPPDVAGIPGLPRPKPGAPSGEGGTVASLKQKPAASSPPIQKRAARKPAKPTES